MLASRGSLDCERRPEGRPPYKNRYAGNHAGSPLQFARIRRAGCPHPAAVTQPRGPERIGPRHIANDISSVALSPAANPASGSKGRSPLPEGVRSFLRGLGGLLGPHGPLSARRTGAPFRRACEKTKERYLHLIRLANQDSQSTFPSRGRLGERNPSVTAAPRQLPLHKGAFRERNPSTAHAVPLVNLPNFQFVKFSCTATNFAEGKVSSPFTREA